jgi:hypothetical protein
MFALKAQIVIMSHLSDAEEAALMGDSQTSLNHIKFAKFLILKSEGNLDTLFEESELNNMWSNLFSSKQKEREAIKQMLKDIDKEMDKES